MDTTQPFFQRYQPPDLQEVLTRVQQDSKQLEQARLTQDEAQQLQLLTWLGGDILLLGKEADAIALIEQALTMAREQSEKASEIENLLNLATAQQYLGKRELAQRLFQEAFEKGRTYGVREFEDFVLHHRGRCYVEQGKLDEAQACFEQALKLREAKEDQRFLTSTRNALAAVNEMRNTSR
uniref:Uncharacterized protein n=1 Tax=Thermosporothrix sp. COM3 TaxID=2490863 RepID=A0A455SIJ1_9CHLR|nr:hypothetical protein KTC_21310 [Thermosporothrix sp. COM3]